MDQPLRIDVLLDRLCLTRSRNEAKTACDAGAVLVEGRAVKPSQTADVGNRITIRFPTRTLEIRLEQIPSKSTSKKAAREMYAVLRDEKHPGEL